MGIDSQYFFGGAAMLATLYLYTHWQNFDGGFHRPGNKFKKQKAKEKAKAERDASARGSQLEADEERERERRRSSTPGPRPSRAELHRGRPRDKLSESRYGAGGGRRGDDRYDDDNSSDDERYNSRAPREQHRGEHASHTRHRVRVQQAPYGDYVWEDEILDDHPSKPALRPVNAHHGRTAERKPADFNIEDPRQPGHHSIREAKYEAYTELFGARDTGHEFNDAA